MYENLIGGKDQQPSPLHVIGAATVSAVVTTAIAYPLDLAHGRMAADMSRKPALIKDARVIKKNKGGKTMLLAEQGKVDRLYESVLDCLQKAREGAGKQGKWLVSGPYAGLPIALVAQVPYTVILMSSFEAFN